MWRSGNAPPTASATADRLATASPKNRRLSRPEGGGPDSITALRIRGVWLAKPDLSAGDRCRLERIGAVGIAFHHHSGGQHHRNRHGCEDKADKSQAVAVRHGHFLTSVPVSIMTGTRFKMR